MARRSSDRRPSWWWWIWIASMSWLPMENTGLREVWGSWRIIEMRRPRMSRISRSLFSRRFSPSSRMAPLTMRAAGRGTSRRSDSAVMVFPQPDSPTMPSVSPSRREKLTPSTALTTPLRVKQYVRRSSTSRMTSPICLGMRSRYGRGRVLLRGLQEMEVRRPPGREAGVDPLRHDLRIGHDLVGEPEERDVGELVVQVVTDRPRQPLPLLRVHGEGQGIVGLVHELVLVVVVRALAVVARPDPLLGRPPRDDVGPDAALDGLLAEHLPHLGPVEHLDLRVDAHVLVVDAEGLGDLRPFRLAGLGEREDLELELAGAVAGLLQECLGLRGVVAVELIEPGLPLRVVALGGHRPACHVRVGTLAGEHR